VTSAAFVAGSSFVSIRDNAIVEVFADDLEQYGELEVSEPSRLVQA
jgi:hypothetical protein